MDKRVLGKDLEVSEIGLGCMGMSHAYGTVSSEKEAEELVAKAIDEGCTFLIRQRYMEQQRSRIIMRNFWVRYYGHIEIRLYWRQNVGYAWMRLQQL